MNDVFVHKTKRWKWQMEQTCYFLAKQPGKTKTWSESGWV